MLSQLFLLVHLLAAGLAATVSRPPVTTVYLVRHGEKDLTPGLPDPLLTTIGEARAQALAKALGTQKLAAVFTTDTRRTRATLAPLATAAGLTPLVYDARKPADLAAQIRRDYAGKAVAVVGHSNTLLPLMAALGVLTALPEIKDEEYDYLFEVRLPASGPVTVKVRHYGAR